MLKHVQTSPMRNRSDSVSLRSSSSSCGSPEPKTPSRASSYSSLNETAPQTTIKIYTACLRLDIEYKTLGVKMDTTSKEIVSQLLRRCKMRQRDPRLFYLTMEITIRRSGARTCLVLDDDARPALLQACYNPGDSKFCLQTKPGGLIRVHTAVLNPSSQYKSLLISEETTSDELLGLILSLYNSVEPVEQFSLYEVCSNQEFQRKLHPDDLPLLTQLKRKQKGENCHFLVRKNPILASSRRLLIGFNEKSNLINNRHSLAAPFSLKTDFIESLTKESVSNVKSDNITNNNNILTISSSSNEDSSNNVNNETYSNSKTSISVVEPAIMKVKCSHKSSLRDLSHVFRMSSVRQKQTPDKSLSFSATSYSPVYNVREIMTQSSNKRNLISEPVNTNPVKGVGNFVYI